MHDVERYRGSCLIVAKPGKGTHSQGGRPRLPTTQEGSPQNHPPGGPQRLSGGSGTGGGGGGGGIHVTTTNAAPSRDNSSYAIESGGSALTGMPLFSFMHQRRSSCRSITRPQHHYTHNHHHQHHNHQQRPQHHLQHPNANALNHHHSSKGHEFSPSGESEEVDDVELLPLAQLALHTHGHPLILSARGGGGSGGGGGSMRGSSAPPPPTRHHHFHHQATAGDHHHQSAQQASSPPTAASDSVSVTSDEGSIGHAENCLPRIIKPRKRRKKDRKPTSGSPPPSGEVGLEGGGGEDSPGTIVTLKPYMPMCYNYNDSNKRGHFHHNPNHHHHRSSSGGGHNDEGKKLGEGVLTSNGEVGCGCEHCVAGQVFPTPPPSPASSASSSSTIISSSCSSSSEDEPHHSMIYGGGVGDPDRDSFGYSGGYLEGLGDHSKQLVRSLSEPQARPSLHITSSISPSFAGHRDLDIRIIRSPARDAPPMRTRHWSVPAVARHRHQPQFNTQGNPFSGSFPSSASLLERHYSYQIHAVTTPQPPQRPWIPLVESDRSKPSCIFTVMCYNVLCDKYATRQMYGYCPSWALEWEYRKKGIMDEIKQYMADIITLQEVETDQFFNFFLPELKAEGYDGIFSPKSRAKHMTESERKYVDGCAIFWRTTKFGLVKERLIEFNQLAMANHDGSEDMLNRVMTKDNIGLAALLETKEAAWENSVAPDKSQINQHILVCTAHIHWDPEFRDVKLIQTIMLMSEIRQIVGQIVEEFNHRSRTGRKLDQNSIQLLLCGDLNSLPESGVVEFLTKGNVSMDHEDFKGFGYKTCLQKIAMANSSNSSLVNTNSNLYTHSFRLSAAYDFSIMAYTNYTYDFKGIIDYIFHNSDTMTALGVLGPIDPEWFRENKVMGCPHPHIPSDHFPLLVQLEMRPAGTSLNHPNGLLHR